MGFFRSVVDNWGQFAAVFFIVFVFAAANETKLTLKSCVEITKGALAIVVIFAFLSAGKGCTRSGDIDSDCRPAGPGIYSDC